MSRPARDGVPSGPVCVRLSEAERERVKEAARVNHQSRSQFIRDAIVTAAEDCLESQPQGQS